MITRSRTTLDSNHGLRLSFEKIEDPPYRLDGQDRQSRLRDGSPVSMETASTPHQASPPLPSVTWRDIQRHAALLPLRPHPSYFLPRNACRPDTHDGPQVNDDNFSLQDHQGSYCMFHSCKEEDNCICESGEPIFRFSDNEDNNNRAPNGMQPVFTFDRRSEKCEGGGHAGRSSRPVPHQHNFDNLPTRETGLHPLYEHDFKCSRYCPQSTGGFPYTRGSQQFNRSHSSSEIFENVGSIPHERPHSSFDFGQHTRHCDTTQAHWEFEKENVFARRPSKDFKFVSIGDQSRFCTENTKQGYRPCSLLAVIVNNNGVPSAPTVSWSSEPAKVTERNYNTGPASFTTSDCGSQPSRFSTPEGPLDNDNNNNSSRINNNNHNHNNNNNNDDDSSSSSSSNMDGHRDRAKQSLSRSNYRPNVRATRNIVQVRFDWKMDPTTLQHRLTRRKSESLETNNVEAQTIMNRGRRPPESTSQGAQRSTPKEPRPATPNQCRNSRTFANAGMDQRGLISTMSMRDDRTSTAMNSKQDENVLTTAKAKSRKTAATKDAAIIAQLLGTTKRPILLSNVSMKRETPLKHTPLLAKRKQPTAKDFEEKTTKAEGNGCAELNSRQTKRNKALTDQSINTIKDTRVPNGASKPSHAREPRIPLPNSEGHTVKARDHAPILGIRNSTTPTNEIKQKEHGAKINVVLGQPSRQDQNTIIGDSFVLARMMSQRSLPYTSTAQRNGHGHGDTGTTRVTSNQCGLSTAPRTGQVLHTVQGRRYITTPAIPPQSLPPSQLTHLPLTKSATQGPPLSSHGIDTRVQVQTRPSIQDASLQLSPPPSPQVCQLPALSFTLPSNLRVEREIGQETRQDTREKALQVWREKGGFTPFARQGNTTRGHHTPVKPSPRYLCMQGDRRPSPCSHHQRKTKSSTGNTRGSHCAGKENQPTKSTKETDGIPRKATDTEAKTSDNERKASNTVATATGMGTGKSATVTLTRNDDK